MLYGMIVFLLGISNRARLKYQCDAVMRPLKISKVISNTLLKLPVFYAKEKVSDNEVEHIVCM